MEIEEACVQSLENQRTNEWSTFSNSTKKPYSNIVIVPTKPIYKNKKCNK